LGTTLKNKLLLEINLKNVYSALRDIFDVVFNSPVYLSEKKKNLRCKYITKVKDSLTIKIIYRVKEEVGHQNPVHNSGSQKYDE
jgi:hypothetical protein